MAKAEYKATIDGLIQCLTDIKEKCGGDTYVQINPIGTNVGCVTGLTSVCLDNDLGNDEALVYIETNIDEAYYPATFKFYTQGEEI